MKGKKLLFISVLLILTLLCLGVSACSKSSDQEEAGKEGTAVAVKENDLAVSDKADVGENVTEPEKEAAVKEENAEVDPSEAETEKEQPKETVKEDKSSDTSSKNNTATTEQGEKKVASSGSNNVMTKKEETVKNNSSTSSKNTTEKKETQNSSSKDKPTPVVPQKEQPTVKPSGTKEQVSVKEQHTHSWVKHTETIPHEEKGHWEKVCVKEAWVEEIPKYEQVEINVCNGCKKKIEGNPADHVKEQVLAGNYKCGGHHTQLEEVPTGEVYTIPHDAEYEEQWVVDEKAWTETKVTYSCSCGATK